MSKTKTKRARRELKREGDRKIAAHHRKAAKASAPPPSTKPSLSAPPTKKRKTNHLVDASITPQAHKPSVQASQQHAVPFGPYDHILLVGEGDFSFARSLVVEHGCANVTATSYDSEEEVRAKYPSFEGIEKDLRGLVPPVPIAHGVDAGKLGGWKAGRCHRGEDDDDDDDDDRGGADTEEESEGEADGVGGTSKPKREGWDTIAFMFPHTGGLSTDVNRQVRANQALLVAFFKACLDTPTQKHRLALLAAQNDAASPRPKAKKKAPFLRMHGRIIVTLFANEPYTLWNIRDLARHTGLKVVESWKFDWAQYPGYTHQRTLGAIEGGGAWRGEDREARMYVFEKVPLVADEEEEEELKKMKRGERGGRLGSQKDAWRRAEQGDQG